MRNEFSRAMAVRAVLKKGCLHLSANAAIPLISHLYHTYITLISHLYHTYITTCILSLVKGFVQWLGPLRKITSTSGVVTTIPLESIYCRNASNGEQVESHKAWMDCAPDAYISSTLRARITLSRALSYPTDASGGDAFPAAGLSFPRSCCLSCRCLSCRCLNRCLSNRPPLSIGASRSDS